MDKEDVVHICNGTLLSYKKNEIMPLATTWTDLEIFILNEVSQKEKDKTLDFLKWHFTYYWFLSENDLLGLLGFPDVMQTCGVFCAKFN